MTIYYLLFAIRYSLLNAKIVPNTDNLSKHTGCGDFGAGAWAFYDQGSLIVAIGPE